MCSVAFLTIGLWFLNLNSSFTVLEKKNDKTITCCILLIVDLTLRNIHVYSTKKCLLLQKILNFID